MPKFGVSSYSISRHLVSGKITPEQSVEWLCEQGAEVIEIVPFGIDLLSDKDLAGRMKAVADKYGVAIDNYSLGANFLEKTDAELAEEIERVKTHIDAAKALGVSTVRSDCAGYGRPVEQNTIETFLEELPVMVKAYKVLAEYAASLGIKLMIENHGFHANGSERVRLILKNVGLDNFGHQLDVGNYICMDEKPEVVVNKMLPFATTVHMKDFYVRQTDPGHAEGFDGYPRPWFRSPGGQYLRGSIFGQGDLDTKSLIKSVKSYGFDGNIFIEYEGIEDCYYGTKVSLDNLKRIYSEV